MYYHYRKEVLNLRTVNFKNIIIIFLCVSLVGSIALIIHTYRYNIELENKMNEIETTYKLKEKVSNEDIKMRAEALQRITIENKKLKEENQQLKAELENKQINNNKTGYTGNFFGDTFSDAPDDYGYDYVNEMAEQAQKHK